MVTHHRGTLLRRSESAQPKIANPMVDLYLRYTLLASLPPFAACLAAAPQILKVFRSVPRVALAALTTLAEGTTAPRPLGKRIAVV